MISPRSTADLLTESAVDALTAVLLPAPGLPTDCLVTSTAGTAPRLPAWLQRFRHLPLLCAYDADPAGDHVGGLQFRFLVFDGRFTTYADLKRLDEAGIRFVTVRRRGRGRNSHSLDRKRPFFLELN